MHAWWIERVAYRWYSSYHIAAYTAVCKLYTVSQLQHPCICINSKITECSNFIQQLVTRNQMHGTDYWSMATSMTTPHRVTTQPGCAWPRSLIYHCNKRAWHFYYTVIITYFVLSVPRSSHDFESTLRQFTSGGPLAAKWTIHGSYTWSGGPFAAT